MSIATKLKPIQDTDHQIEHTCPPRGQHGQFGPVLPDPPTHPGQRDGVECLPDDTHDAGRDRDAVQAAREHQQVDLAMLRLAFRNILFAGPDHPNVEQQPDQQLRELSCSELNQLTSAVVRIHGDERELLGIEAIENQQTGDNHDDHLELLSTPQLLELCYKEGITPPSACQTETETQDTVTTGET